MFKTHTHLDVHVRPGDLDSLGHVNNAKVLEFFELGRWEWLQEQPLSTQAGAASVVTRIEVDYHREIRQSRVRVETVLVSPDVAGYDAADPDDAALHTYKATFRQTIHGAGDDGAKLVSAVVQVAFVDTEEGCLIPVDEYFDLAASPQGV